MPHPPRRAEELVAWLVPGDKGRTILGDLREDFLDVVLRRGERKARRWYWRTVVGLGLGLAVRRRGRWLQRDGRRLQKGDGMRGFAGDVRMAFRRQRRAVGSTVVVVLTLGVGLGSSTAVFSALDAVMVRYPFTDPGRIVLIGEDDDGDMGRLTVPDVEVLRRSGRTAVVAAYRPANLNLTGIDIPERLPGAYATPGFFELLGVVPAVGTGLDDADGASRPPAVVLSHDAWRRLAGGSTEALGTTLTLDGTRHDVAGVLPEDFWFPERADVWLSAADDEAFTDPSDTRRVYRALGRLHPGITAATARDELRIDLAAGRAGEAPELVVTPLREAVVGEADRVLILLQAAAGFFSRWGSPTPPGSCSLDPSTAGRKRDCAAPWARAAGAWPGPLSREDFSSAPGAAPWGS